MSPSGGDFTALRNLGVFCFSVAAATTSIVAAIAILDHLRQPPTPPLEQAQSSLERRFQLTQLGEFRRDQFLLDQDTGRIWHPVCIGTVSGTDCQGVVAWEEMSVTPPPIFDDIFKSLGADSK